MNYELGNLMDGRPFWVGKFTFGGASFLTYDNYYKCWGSMYNEFTNEFELRQLENGELPLNEPLYNLPSFIGNFYKGNDTQTLIYGPTSRSWWIGQNDFPYMSWKPLVSNFPGTDFISVWNNKSYWIGDFNGDGKSEILIYINDLVNSHWWLGDIVDSQIKWNSLGNSSLPSFDKSKYFSGMFVNGSTQLLQYSTDDKTWYLHYLSQGKFEWIKLENYFDKDCNINFSGNTFLTGNFTDPRRAQIFYIDPINSFEWVGTVDNGKLWWKYSGTFTNENTANGQKQWYVGNFDGNTQSQILMIDNKNIIRMCTFKNGICNWKDIVFQNNCPEQLNDIDISKMSPKIYVGNFRKHNGRFHKSYLISYSESSGNIWSGELNPGTTDKSDYITWSIMINTSSIKNKIIKEYEKNKNHLGTPLTGIECLPDGKSLYMKFENGIIQQVDSEVYTIHSQVYKEWIKSCDILGYPKSNEIIKRFDNNKFALQSFTNGLVYRVNNSKFASTSNDGISLPKIPYVLTLDSVICEKETPGPGSDDFWITLVTSTSKSARASGEKTTLCRWRDTTFDTSEHHDTKKVLFQGSLPDVMTVSLLALEEDGEDQAKEVLNKFDSETSKFDGNIAYDEAEEVIVELSTLLGALGGAGIGALVSGGAVVEVVVNGVVVEVITSTTLAGAISGAAYGAAIGLVAGLILLVIYVKFLPPELIAVDRITISGSDIRNYIGTKEVPPPYSSEYKGIKYDVYYFWDEDILFEVRTYETKESRYSLKFGHFFGNV